MFPRSTREYVVNSDPSHIEPLGNLALTEPSGSQSSYLQHLRFGQFRVVVSLSPWCVITHGGSHPLNDIQCLLCPSSDRTEQHTIFDVIVPRSVT